MNAVRKCITSGVRKTGDRKDAVTGRACDEAVAWAGV